MYLAIDAVLVPQGVEYQAIWRSLEQVPAPKPTVVAIPVGWEPLARYLEKWRNTAKIQNQRQPQVLLMGLCGSLTPAHAVGDIVIYQGCIDGRGRSDVPWQLCDLELTARLNQILAASPIPIRALTSDRLIYSATEKQQLGQKYSAQVVDMEGFVVLEALSQSGIAVGMVRVISDDCHYDLPDLSRAFSPEGGLRPLPLAMGMLQQPIAAARLIQGSLQGLQRLQQVTTCLFG
jgi:hypothetical protein